MPPDVRRHVDTFRKSGGAVVSCPIGVRVEDLWQTVRRAVEQAKLARRVRADRWGIECRGATLGRRKLMYLLNHTRKPVEVTLKSEWSLANAIDLRTQGKLDASRMRLESLEIRFIEVK
jgi:hypothetical protein